MINSNLVSLSKSLNYFSLIVTFDLTLIEIILPELLQKRPLCLVQTASYVAIGGAIETNQFDILEFLMLRLLEYHVFIQNIVSLQFLFRILYFLLELSQSIANVIITIVFLLSLSFFYFFQRIASDFSIKTIAILVWTGLNFIVNFVFKSGSVSEVDFWAGWLRSRILCFLRIISTMSEVIFIHSICQSNV